MARGARFETINDLYLAFGTAQADIGSAPTDETSFSHLQAQIEKERWSSAIALCAYLLPRREAVWWGSTTLRSLLPQMDVLDLKTLEMVDDWVRGPDEKTRIAVLDRANASDPRSPATWIAFGAAWSGGNIVAPEHGVVMAQPHLTARAIRAALLIALCYVPGEKSAELLRPCLMRGLSLASPAR